MNEKLQFTVLFSLPLLLMCSDQRLMAKFGIEIGMGEIEWNEWNWLISRKKNILSPSLHSCAHQFENKLPENGKKANRHLFN
jgi:hypothetical protein